VLVKLLKVELKNMLKKVVEKVVEKVVGCCFEKDVEKLCWLNC
jgi:hypothetical protein